MAIVVRAIESAGAGGVGARKAHGTLVGQHALQEQVAAAAAAHLKYGPRDKAAQLCQSLSAHSIQAAHIAALDVGTSDPGYDLGVKLGVLAWLIRIWVQCRGGAHGRAHTRGNGEVLSCHRARAHTAVERCLPVAWAQLAEVGSASSGGQEGEGVQAGIVCEGELVGFAWHAERTLIILRWVIA